MLISGLPSFVLWNAAALFVYMTIVFVIAYRRKRLDTVDAAWGGAFVVAATMVAGLQPTLRTIIIALLIDIWALRLSSHIIDRIRNHDQDDPRYTELASKWKGSYWQRAYLSIFMVQGMAALIISLPTVFATGDDTAFATAFLVAGIAVWVIGFIVEMIGDRQLKAFLANKNNKGKVLDQGLWRYTRHPNYLGELTQWYGIGIIACGAQWGWIGLIGPVALNVLIRFVSGVPPIENRKKKDKAYAAYMQRTYPILPRLTRVKTDLVK